VLFSNSILRPGNSLGPRYFPSSATGLRIHILLIVKIIIGIRSNRITSFHSALKARPEKGTVASIPLFWSSGLVRYRTNPPSSRSTPLNPYWD
jgi:hypothetical protein